MPTIKKMSPSFVVLAAGFGKRMKSDLPKVLHEIAGESLIIHILETLNRCVKKGTLNDASEIQSAKISPFDSGSKIKVAVVVGHGKDQVINKIQGHSVYKDLEITFIEQDNPKGTGHALQCVMSSSWGTDCVNRQAKVVVLPGDLPLIQEQLLMSMVLPAQTSKESIRLLMTELENPKGYGRVLMRGKKILRIVEEKDANPAQKKIKQVATSIYTFDSQFLKSALPKLKTKNAQSEYYLTDLIEIAARSNKKITPVLWEDSQDLRGINDLWELAEAEKILVRRIVKEHCTRGVRFYDVDSVMVEGGVQIESGAIIHRGVVLRGKTKIGARTEVGSNVVLRNTIIGSDVKLKAGTYCEDSQVMNGAVLGPYAHLRPESHVGESAKIGNFVELKKTTIGAGSSVAHLSYLGDAIVGSKVNIGCGFVTCNFDGRVINGSRKHQTIIEDEAFIGSDCQTVAPLKVGKGAYVASGSTLTEDVEPGSLAIARTRQVNKPGYARKLASQK